MKEDCDLTLPLCIFGIELMMQLSQYNACCLSKGTVLIPSLLHFQMHIPSGNTKLRHHAWEMLVSLLTDYFNVDFLAYFFPLTSSSVSSTQLSPHRSELKSRLVVRSLYKQLLISPSL